MKIAIIGYSGSGKSTLAMKLGSFYECDVLHLDSVQFLPGWEIRSQDEKEQRVKAFLESHDSWVIDGNYSNLYYEQRMEEADMIIMLLFHRFTCLYRVAKRFRKYKHTTRPDMGEGCNEKLDVEFVWWVLHEGRTKRAKKRYKNVLERYKDKTVVIKNQRQLNRWMDNMGLK